MHPDDGPFSLSLLAKEAKLPGVVLLTLWFVLLVLTLLIYFLLGSHQQKIAVFLFILMTLLAIGITAFYIRKGFIIVQEQQAVVVERLGQFYAVYQAGPHIVLPFIDNLRGMRIRAPDSPQNFIDLDYIDLREMTVDLPAQMVITRDNVQVEVDSVVHYRIADPKKAIYGIANVVIAMEELIKTSLRDVIGGITLQEVLSGRDKINAQLKQNITRISEDWGVHVRDVGLQDVKPPRDLLDAMTKKQAFITEAEGKKRASIAEAEGEAEKIRTVYGTTDVLLKIKYLEALEKIANGQATKVFIPFPNDPNQAGLFSNLMSFAAGLGEASAVKDFNPGSGGQNPKPTSANPASPSPSAGKPEPSKPVQKVVKSQQPVVKRPPSPPSPPGPSEKA